MTEINTKIAGVSFCQEAAKDLVEDQELLLMRDPAHSFDPEAVKIMTKTGLRLGYIKKEKGLNAKINYYLKQKQTITCKVLNMTGGTEQKTIGVNIVITTPEQENNEEGEEKNGSDRDSRINQAEQQQDIN